MIAVDSAVIVDLLADTGQPDAAEAALREALARGPVVVCDVVVAEICSALRDGDQAMQALEEMGIAYS
ncbi:MAG: PIN domain-containing protein, partial [Rhizobacter sp.]